MIKNSDNGNVQAEYDLVEESFARLTLEIKTQVDMDKSSREIPFVYCLSMGSIHLNDQIENLNNQNYIRLKKR